MKRLILSAIAMAALASSAHKDAYILAYEDGITFNAGTDIEHFKQLRQRYTGKYLWVRREGHEYVVRDENTLLRARALFSGQSALAPEQVAVAREETALDRGQDRLENAPDTAENRRRRGEIRAKLKDVERREEALDRREDELETAAERELWQVVDTAIRVGVAKLIR